MIERVNLIEIDLFEFGKQKEIYTHIIDSINKRIQLLEDHQGSIDDIKALYDKKELEYWNMLNLKCVLDNSKMINLLSGSPQKQAN